MKKFKYLFVLLLAILIIPFITFAEDEEEVDSDAESVEVTEASEDNESSDNGEVKLYFFRGEGCSHCAEAKEWFSSIEEEYGNMFEIVDYETWYDEDNKELMDKVAEARGEEAEGVPYIIIGNKSWNGFTDSYKEEIIAEIKSEYEKGDSKYDIMKNLNIKKKSKKKEDNSGDVVALLVILAVTGGVCYGVYVARNNTK